MQLSDTVDNLQDDLRNLAGLGDDAVSQAASRLASAMAGPVTMRLLELLGQAALELGEQLPAGRVELRISGRDAELVYTEHAVAPEVSELGEDQTARISLRLAEQLKAQIEQAAARESVSTNAFIVRALSRAVATGKSAQQRNRLTGYGWA